MRWALLSLWLLLVASCDEVVVLAGGEPRPDVKTPKVYNKGKLQFSYPGNWAPSEEDQRMGGVRVHTVWVKSKGNAMALVQTLLPPVPVDLDNYSREFLGGMNQEFKKSWNGMIRAGDVKKTSFSGELLGAEREGRRLRFMLKALGFPQPMEVTLLGAQLSDGSVVMGTMVAVKHRERVEPGYAQIRSSVTFGGSSGR